MLNKSAAFPHESLTAFHELKNSHHGDKDKALKIGGAATCGGAAAAAAAPAAIGAVGYTATGIAANSWAAYFMAIEAVASGGGVAAGGFTATMQSVGAVGIVGSGLVIPIVLAGALVGAGAACAVFAFQPSKTEASKTRDYADVGDYSSIAHGNIVAFHSESHNRFIRIYEGCVNGHGGHKDIGKFPTDWDSEEFLVVQVTAWSFAFYSVRHCQYLCMNEDRQMTAVDRKLQEDDPTFDEHEFVVRDDGNGKISFLSTIHDSFVRMDDEGNIDGNAKSAKEWELFNVVLLLENPLRIH